MALPNASVNLQDVQIQSLKPKRQVQGCRIEEERVGTHYKPFQLDKYLSDIALAQYFLLKADKYIFARADHHFNVHSV